MKKGCDTLSTCHSEPYFNSIVPEILSWCALMITGILFEEASAKIKTLSAKLAVASGNISKG